MTILNSYSVDAFQKRKKKERYIQGDFKKGREKRKMKVFFLKREHIRIRKRMTYAIFYHISL